MVLDNILLALSELKANKMRSFLTMLGIMIGIASVISIMTLGDALQNSTQSELGENLSNLIEIQPIQKGMKDMMDYQNYDKNVRWLRENEYLTLKTINDLQTHFSDQLKGVNFETNVGKITVGKEKLTLKGVNALGFDTKRKITIIEGRKINNDEYAKGRKVVMIPLKKANALYGSAKNAIGQPFEGQVGDKFYSLTVVGVYEKGKDGAIYSMMVNDGSGEECFTPYAATIDMPMDSMRFDYLDLIAMPDTDITKLSADICSFLNTTQYADSDAYKIDAYSVSDEVDSIKSVLDITRAVFAAIAAISLLVGGIGVMNIMVVSITERTREIGTRKALGATNNDIRGQFLVESVIICLIGSAFGILLGLGLGAFASKMLGVAGTASLTSIVGSVGFSMVFGVFFGFYPANKAAKLDPIVALRYE